MRKQAKQLLITLLAGLLLCGVVACEKKEEAKPAHDAHATPGHEGHDHDAHGGEKLPEGHAKPETAAAPKTVVVSDEVRAAWTEVSIAVKEKESGTVKNYQVKPESEFTIEGTTLTVKLGAYLPDFSMTPGEIVSRSADHNNPAVQVTISEDGTEKYKGWLFAKFPDMHAFEHAKFGITLVDKDAGAAAATPAH